MSSIDKLAVRFTAFALAIVLLGFAVHSTEAGINAKATSTLDQHNANDKSPDW
jgi:hypothetical protein